MKDNGVAKEAIAHMAGLIGLVIIAFWISYHMNQNGAASQELLLKKDFKEETSPLYDSKSDAKIEVDVKL